MVVQCPSCQSRFRIADDKVTDKGVRVRCTSCKNVFPVTKADAADAPGTRPSTGPIARAAKPATGPIAASKPSTGPIAASKPSTGPIAPTKPSTGPISAGKRGGAGDLFGMSALTGDAPPLPETPAATKPAPTFDDLDLDLAPRPKPQPSVVLDALDTPRDGAPPPSAAAQADAGLELDHGTAQAAAAEAPAPARPERRSESKPAPGVPVPPRPPVAAPATARDVVMSALIAVAGAALALALLVGSAQNEDGSTPWLGLFPAKGEIVATRVVSGLYDTSGGKPVFYVRGRIENRGTRARGPVKIVAELTSDSGAPARAETIAGAEPTPEDVWSVTSAADADKLARALDAADADRHVAPGKSLPFFALIAEPPADLSGHKLHVRVEPVEGWLPAAQRAQKP